MIENEELGLKVAVDPIEALWKRTRDACEARIKDLENALIVEKAVFEMCEGKLQTFSSASEIEVVENNTQ